MILKKGQIPIGINIYDENRYCIAGCLDKYLDRSHECSGQIQYKGLPKSYAESNYTTYKLNEDFIKSEYYKLLTDTFELGRCDKALEDSPTKSRITLFFNLAEKLLSDKNNSYYIVTTSGYPEQK